MTLVIQSAPVFPSSPRSRIRARSESTSNNEFSFKQPRVSGVVPPRPKGNGFEGRLWDNLYNKTAVAARTSPLKADVLDMLSKKSRAVTSKHVKALLGEKETPLVKPVLKTQQAKVQTPTKLVSSVIEPKMEPKQTICNASNKRKMPSRKVNTSVERFSPARTIAPKFFVSQRKVSPFGGTKPKLTIKTDCEQTLFDSPSWMTNTL